MSGERGSTITVCTTVNPVGNTIPPVFVFLRAKFHDSLLFGAPEGSLGLVNSTKSGWMISGLFLQALEHIKKHTKCSKENKILLLMDNHESHCSLDAILFARENGIVLVTFPPHCSHRLQPLDVGILGPFKSKLKIAENDWLLSNPGKTVTIHNLAALTNTAYIASFTPKNITTAFKAKGTWPLSRLVFTEEDFEASHVISAPINNTSVLQQDSSSPLVDLSPVVVSCTTENQPSTSKENSAVLSCTPEKSKHCETNTSRPKGRLTPEEVWPFPKAESRSKIGGRKKGKSTVVTETPEKNRVEQEMLKRLEKKSKLGVKKIKFEKIKK